MYIDVAMLAQLAAKALCMSCCILDGLNAKGGKNIGHIG